MNSRNLRIVRDKAVVRLFGFPRFYSIVLKLNMEKVNMVFDLLGANIE